MYTIDRGAPDPARARGARGTWLHHRLCATRGRRQIRCQTDLADPPLIAWCVSMREVSGAAVGPTLQREHYMGARSRDRFRRWPYIKAAVGPTWDKPDHSPNSNSSSLTL
ncbi:hypothetical protein PGT21_013696 [Puccinia graminis f. sp. tritici]|uniref:Uncharacterized protein n=1 Tax=Puccinia graminis f. sp. tritici TaxID=56615 RepID=A0A5B0LKY5_PUCGR|nr:hypothetical protein PGT21_013696 [Puccinia graminis f. sp. tritici]